MACGNNMVSRSSLQSPPSALAHPSPTRVDAAVRQDAQQAVTRASTQIADAKVAVQRASSEAAVKSALLDAEKALNAARRAGRAKQSKDAVRRLERDVDSLRRAADERRRDISNHEDHERATRVRMAMAVDRLAPAALGVPTRIVHAEAGRRGAWNPELNEAQPDAAVVVDSRAVFETDSLGRTVRAQTVLDQVAIGSDRNRAQQVTAGGVDRLATDDGAHIFATMFGGIGEGINIQAMDRSINRGAYERLEELWRQQIESGGQVHVEANFQFEGESRRPSQMEITFHFGDGGEPVTIPFYQ